MEVWCEKNSNILNKAFVHSFEKAFFMSYNIKFFPNELKIENYFES